MEDGRMDFSASSRGRAVALALALALALTASLALGCARGEDAATRRQPAAAQPMGSTAASEEAAEPEPPRTPDGTPLSEALPYEGLAIWDIDKTWLGPHDEQGEPEGAYGGDVVPYYWHADNGTGDRVFCAYVRESRVVKVKKIGKDTTYWALEGDPYATRDLPDLTSSGEVVRTHEVPSIEGEPPHPEDYDDPEEFEMDSDRSDALTYWESVV